ncbi:MAG: hypothetical protein ACD_74C00075G0003, partial [uncultured bacterium]
MSSITLRNWKMVALLVALAFYTAFAAGPL